MAPRASVVEVGRLQMIGFEQDVGYVADEMMSARPDPIFAFSIIFIIFPRESYV